MSTDADIRENIEKLKQAKRDAKRLKRELASQIKDLDAKLEKAKVAFGRKRTGI